MNITIPVYVEERVVFGATQYTVRPLFSPEIFERAQSLSRALMRLSNVLHRYAAFLSRQSRHDELETLLFHPAFEDRVIELQLDVKGMPSRLRLLFVGFETLDRWIWMAPAIGGLQFENGLGEDLAQRAETVVNRHFRDRVRGGDEPWSGEGLIVGRLAGVELQVLVSGKDERGFEGDHFAAGDKDGESELRRSGHGLHELYPGELIRAVGREREVERVMERLTGAMRRSLLLLGARKVGKTSVLHEAIWRIKRDGEIRGGSTLQVWHLSPMRLISGMSVVGQWETRLQAIFKYAAERDLILYFDDWPGMFSIGRTLNSDVSLAQVLKQHLSKGQVRVIGEVSPEVWRRFREKDRGFADMMEVLPIEEMGASETQQVMVGVVQELEAGSGCLFSLEVVPTVFELTRRFVRDAVFPGKGAEFLGRLARRHAGRTVRREQVLQEFGEQTGLDISVLDERTRVRREEVVERIGKRLKGQPAVVSAFADRVMALKARLNDPRRPVGVMLLLGATGVGKTESAKVLAEFLYGSEDRLLRFDMNQFVDPLSAGQLTGTPGEPDGLLTGAVRRQPFSVILLDEIEKASSEVFDLLLALLDEGRLTDAMGRVADFTQSVVLLTSNLGAQEARSRMGYGLEALGEDQIYRGAAEKFFKPEFFNRLDAVVPFRRLGLQELDEIIQRVLQGVLSRDGLVRRRASFEWTERARSRLLEMGADANLGARALKRVIEREVAQPLGEVFAASAPGLQSMALLDFREDQFCLQIEEMRPVARCVEWWDRVASWEAEAGISEGMKHVGHAVLGWIGKVRGAVATRKPKGPSLVGSMGVAESRYFLCSDQLKRVGEALERLDEESQGQGRGAGARGPVVPHRFLLKAEAEDEGLESGRVRGDLHSAEGVGGAAVILLLEEVAVMEAMLRAERSVGFGVLMFWAKTERELELASELRGRMGECFERHWGCRAKEMDWGEAGLGQLGSVMWVEGAYVEAMMTLEPMRLVVDWGTRELGMILVESLRGESMAELRDRVVARMEAVEKGGEDGEWSGRRWLGPVTMGIDERGGVVDYRSGARVRFDAGMEAFHRHWARSLPLPVEVEELLNRGGES